VHTTQEEINKKGLPRRNERDIKDVPEELRKQLTYRAR
jgi:ATP-dependent Lon protease